MIADLDETLMDNSPYQARRVLAGAGYSSESWRAWVEEARARVRDVLAPELRPFLLAGEPVLQLDYPLAQVPPKLVSVQLDKLPLIGGRLQGIKGQYLVWADGRVLNVRNHIGFHVEVDGS